MSVTGILEELLTILGLRVQGQCEVGFGGDKEDTFYLEHNIWGQCLWVRKRTAFGWIGLSYFYNEEGN